MINNFRHQVISLFDKRCLSLRQHPQAAIRTSTTPKRIGSQLYSTVGLTPEEGSDSGHTKYIPLEGYDTERYYFFQQLDIRIVGRRPISHLPLSAIFPLISLDPEKMPKAPKNGFYAVKAGRKPGIYSTWAECQAQVNGFSSSQYKKFATKQEAIAFVGGIPQEGQASSSKPYARILKSSNRTKEGRYDYTDPPNQRPTFSNTSVTAREAGYTISEDGHLVVYCDGSSKGNGKTGAKAGLGVYWGKSGPAEAANLAEAVPGKLQTNNRGELLAIIRALEENPYPDLPLEIRTDSKYSIGCLTQYLPKWLRNGFKTATGQPIKNYDLIVHLFALMNEMGSNRIKLTHVKGHAGHWGNEEADRLANLGATRPTPPDRKNWLTLEEANNAAKAAKSLRQKELTNGSKAPQTESSGQATDEESKIEILVDVDSDWLLSPAELLEEIEA